jgi:hypothetical protein
MLYCMEYLSANLDWLQERLAPLADSNHYFIFDCPGQVELFTGQEAFKQVGHGSGALKGRGVTCCKMFCNVKGGGVQVLRQAVHPTNEY